MRTPTNHEDNQLWREAAALQARKDKRETDISALIDESLDRLRKALRDDFNLSNREITVRLFYRAGIADLEELGESDSAEKFGNPENFEKERK